MTPAAADQVFAYKFQGAVAFSSWAFLLLGTPVLVGYGVVRGVSWYFFALLPLYFLGFVLLPGSVGALACLVIVNFVPRRRRQVLVLVVIVLILLAVGWSYHLWWVAQQADLSRAEGFQSLLDQVSFAGSTLLPTHWMSRGLQAAAQGDLRQSSYRLALVWSNGLFMYLLTAWAARRLYRRGYNRVATGGELRRRYGGSWMDRLFAASMFPLDPQTRLLIVKDFRTFRRDPAQWAQIVIFVILITVYFFYTRSFYQEGVSPLYRNGISLTNLAATAVLLCAYTGRFIFPMLSLEGRKFWVLGLLPLRRERLIWGKFAYSAIGATLIAEFLIVFSELMLAISPITIVLHVLTVAVLALGLSGLSVGLGAVLPNFRETDPSKIVAGFGGTMNLIASLLFLVVVLVLMAVPWHLYAASGQADDAAWGALPWWVLALAVLGLGVGVVATVVPLRMGTRALRRMEF